MDVANSKTNTGLTQFHLSRSPNIMLQKDSTVALCQNLSSGKVFSKYPLVAGEIFLLDFKAESAGTKGSYNPFPMVLQLKQTTPNASAPLDFRENVIFAVQQPDDDEVEVHNDFLGDGDYIQTARGLIPKSILLPSMDSGVDKVYVRIGIFFVPMKDNPKKAQINVIVNGKNLSLAPHSMPLDDLPYDNMPLYLMIMFCGTIKEVRIVQYQGVLPSLQNACRTVIRENYTMDEIWEMPIPMRIKRFLLGTGC